MDKAKTDPDRDDDDDAKGATKSDEKILQRARDDWEACQEYWGDHKTNATDDLQFARLEVQWPAKVKAQRILEGRPCETFNKMPSFIRQVVNDARQNKPAIKVHPADSNADPRTADVINELIRNIEVTSDADVACDTAIEHAVDRGLGYFRIDVKSSCDDSFERDIVFERIINPLTVYGDPDSEAADSSDWNRAFISKSIPVDRFKADYPDADEVDWDGAEMKGWRDGKNVIVAEYWVREKVLKTLVSANGDAVWKEDFDRRVAEGEQLVLDANVQPEERDTYKVTQYILTGNQVLKTVAWAGKYIPIIPVYGDEVVDEDSKRHYSSLIRPAKGAQRMYNYMRNTSIEMVGLAPRVPYIGEEGAFDVDPNWAIANNASLSKLEYKKGSPPPQRQPYSGVPSGVIQETLSANDDMKAIMGIYDASLGNRSNETSGRAIRARQAEGDTATFHFIDNLSRAIRHAGRILIDLIPKVYNTKRVIRVLGEDLKPRNVQIAPTGQAVSPQYGEPGPDGNAPEIGHIFDITAGKYDLTVKSGPSFGTRREEAREEIVEIIRNVPDSAPILGPMYLRNSDWPGAEDAADKLEQGNQPQIPPEMQQMIQQGQEALQQQAQRISELEQALKSKQGEIAVKSEANQIHAFEATTHRIQATRPTILKPGEMATGHPGG